MNDRQALQKFVTHAVSGNELSAEEKKEIVAHFPTKLAAGSISAFRYGGDQKLSQVPKIDLFALANTTEIGPKFLYAMKSLLEVDLSPCVNVEKIGKECFAECKALVQVDLAPLANCDIDGDGFLMDAHHVKLVNADKLDASRVTGSDVCASWLRDNITSAQAIASAVKTTQGPSPITVTAPSGASAASGSPVTSPSSAAAAAAARHQRLNPTSLASPFTPGSNAASPCAGGGKVKLKCLFIGIDYHLDKSESRGLRGCNGDVTRMRDWLMAMGYDISDCRVLVDDPEWKPPRTLHDDASHSVSYIAQPTKENIQSCFKWLIDGAKRGDKIFFQFSGHGMQIEPMLFKVAKTPPPKELLNHTCIVPLIKGATQHPAEALATPGEKVDIDFDAFIYDHWFFEQLCTLPAGVRATMIFDCCRSGEIASLPFQYRFDQEQRLMTQQEKMMMMFPPWMRPPPGMMAMMDTQEGGAEMEEDEGVLVEETGGGHALGGAGGSGETKKNEKKPAAKKQHPPGQQHQTGTHENKHKNEFTLLSPARSPQTEGHTVKAHVLCISACRSDQDGQEATVAQFTESKSIDSSFARRNNGGVLTQAIIGVHRKITESADNFTYENFFRRISTSLKEHGFRQIPTLSASHPLDMQDFFSVHDKFAAGDWHIHAEEEGEKHAQEKKPEKCEQCSVLSQCVSQLETALAKAESRIKELEGGSPTTTAAAAAASGSEGEGEKKKEEEGEKKEEKKE